MLFVEKVNCRKFSNGKWNSAKVSVPKEIELSINVNQKRFVSILSTPIKTEYLVIGFLYSEGIISNLDNIESITINEEQSSVDVCLKNKKAMPAEKIFASGFGKGVIFKTDGKKIKSDLSVQSEQILLLMEQLNKQMEIYQVSGGVHASALADKASLISIAEDIGRHNTLDKIQGECLKKSIATKDKIILTTGRISTEMLLKSSKMEIPIVISMKSPTGNAVSLAEHLDITLVGHAKRNSFIVYTHCKRIK